MSNVSIIIPCYQQERFIAETIDSALNQTHDRIEVIVVNDGSTDGSHDIISSYGDRIRYISKANEGVSKTRNRGAEVASGKYLIFLDGDDILHPQAVENHLRLMGDSETGISVLGEIKFRGTTPPPDTTSIQGVQETTSLPNLFEGNPGIPARTMVHRHEFEKSGGFTLNTWGCEDWHMLLQLAILSSSPEKHSIRSAETIGAYYRLSDINRTNNTNAMFLSMADMFCNIHETVISKSNTLSNWGGNLVVAQTKMLSILIAKKIQTPHRKQLALNLRHLHQLGFSKPKWLTDLVDNYLGMENRIRLTLVKTRFTDPVGFKSYRDRNFQDG